MNMCHLTGYLAGAKDLAFGSKILREKMGTRISTREPEGGGRWQGGDAQIGLGHRRFTIIDLFAAAHYSTEFSSSRYVTGFNGETHNHLYYRVPLEADGYAVCWRTTSGTGTLLAEVNAWAKWELRQAWHRYLPNALIERSKMGFSASVHSWLHDPFKDCTEDLLSESRLNEQGYLRPDLIRRRWAEHSAGQRDCQHVRRIVLMFQSWLSAQSRTEKVV